MTHNLHPCPWCGKTANLSVCHSGDAGNMTVSCWRCCIDGPEGRDEQQAVDKWNRRELPEWKRGVLEASSRSTNDLPRIPVDTETTREGESS